MDDPLAQFGLAIVLLAVVAASLLAAPGPDGLLGAFLGALMLSIAATDARRYIIPNELTAAAAALGLLRAATIGPDAGWSGPLWAAARALAVALPFLALMAGYRAYRGRDGLGMGDIKLAAVAGAWLGFMTVLAAIEVATLAALAAYIGSGALRRRPLRATAFLPFGLFLAPAIWLGWLAEALLG
ncbi:prepilin peptidase [Bradyrhizobium tropiciagri]|uniref:prepilin peptidase n=1 Tax=Bradyrhizobium tropiciagri TaxID=312253 RepID=UPI001BA96D74|nr:A24 family peptidase [Bradyrhizobium tropiciagri]MBR0875102.1 prepilin peptidase [Bradyrhizobium tropiciagri]